MDKEEFRREFSDDYRAMLQAKHERGTFMDITELMWMVWCHAKTTNEQQAEIERLRAALWDYGEHILTCRVRDGGECNCGFFDLIKNIEPPAVNEQTTVKEGE